MSVILTTSPREDFDFDQETKNVLSIVTTAQPQAPVQWPQEETP